MNKELEKLVEQANQGLITQTGRKPYKSSNDLAGRVFGKLTVIQRLPNHANCTRWLCECVCGESVAVLGSNLKSGGSKSCGCMRYKRGSESQRWKGRGELTGRHWSIIQTNASRRGHSIEITIDEVWALYERQQGKCALTGWDITLSAPTISDITASLDRIDSSLGYIVGNVQWVHKHVNLSKNIHSQDYFVAMCIAIADNAKGIQ